MLKLHMLIVIVRSAFEEDGNIIHKFFSMFIGSINARIW